jgi:hypothetical protein
VTRMPSAGTPPVGEDYGRSALPTPAPDTSDAHQIAGSSPQRSVPRHRWPSAASTRTASRRLVGSRQAARWAVERNRAMRLGPVFVRPLPLPLPSTASIVHECLTCRPRCGPVCYEVVPPLHRKCFPRCTRTDSPTASHLVRVVHAAKSPNMTNRRINRPETIALRQDLPTVLTGLEAAWAFLQGVVRRLVVDNLKPVAPYPVPAGPLFRPDPLHRGRGRRPR